MPEIKDHLIYEMKTRHNIGKLACFDLDDTMIRTKDRSRFPKNKDDWYFWNDCIINTLRQYNKKKFDVVIFTTQKQIRNNKTKKEEFLEKLKNILNKLRINISYFISLNDGYYAKPCTGAFDVLLREYKKDKYLRIHKDSFYCGDCAGRVKGWEYTVSCFSNMTKTYIKVRKDYDYTDLFFAHNCELQFYVPEQMFGSSVSTSPLPLPDRQFMKVKRVFKIYKTEEIVENIINMKDDRLMLIIMMGLPRTGKTYLANEIKKAFDEKCKGLDILSLDTIKTRHKIRSTFSENIWRKRNMLIDDTNARVEDRQFYIENQKNYKIVGINVTTDLDVMYHLNYYTTQISKGEVPYINNLIYNKMRKKLVPLTKEEGCDEIVEYKFKVYRDLFRNKEFMNYFC